MLRLVMNSIPEAIFWKDRNSVYLDATQYSPDMLDYHRPKK